MCRESRYANEGGGVGPCGDEALVVEQRAEDGELVGFVVFSMYDEDLVQGLLEFSNL